MIEFALGILLLPLMFLFMGGLWWLAGWVLKLESEWWIGVIILLGGVMTVWLLSWFAQLLGVTLTAQGSGSTYHVTYGSRMSFMPNLGYMNHYFVIGGFSGLVGMRIVSGCGKPGADTGTARLRYQPGIRRTSMMKESPKRECHTAPVIFTHGSYWGSVASSEKWIR